MRRSAIRFLLLPVFVCATFTPTLGEELPQGVADTTGTAGTNYIPFPFFFYTPETGTAGGGTVLMYLRSGRPDERPSTISPVFIYTAKKQTIALLYGEFYHGDGAYRLNTNVSYTKFPNTFWGVGNDAPDADEENFTSRTWNLSATLEKQVRTGLYLGGGFWFGSRKLLEIVDGGLLESGVVPGSGDGKVVSARLSATYDTRDNVSNPQRGHLYTARVSLANGTLGSDYDYLSSYLDLHSYIPATDSSVFAFQILAETKSATPPFDLLPQLGGDSLLRGYFAGRYRDRSLLLCQAEWRTNVWRRLGGVVFGGVGQVAHDWNRMSVDDFHGAYGFGLRFLLNREERLNLRMDWGFGADSSGFYVSMGEAF